ncbi:MAG: hypothetical protein Tsb006_4810 [Rickettsiaceae bacterium]
MSSYNEIIDELKAYAKELSSSYIKLKQRNEKNCESFFALNVVALWSKYKDYLAMMNKAYRLDLEDCIRTHGDRYLTFFVNNNVAKAEIDQYSSNVRDVLGLFKKTSTRSINGLESDKLALISDRVYKITRNPQTLFAQQNFNKAVNDNMQAIAIAFSLDSLGVEEQNRLVDRLLLIKEIWSIEVPQEAQKETIKFKLHADVKGFVGNKDLQNSEAALAKIIDSLIKDNILQSLSDNQLIHLYDRLKNYDLKEGAILSLLDKLHEEARFRYSYNRLDDSGYELLNRFQTYDTLAGQIEAFEFAVIESYLLYKNDFLEQLLTLLLKQVDNIRMSSFAKDKSLLAVLKKVDTKLYHIPGREKDKIKSLLSAFRGRLGNPMDSHVQKRYLELDRYATNALRKRYQTLFEKILHLFDNDALGRKFLRESFVAKLTHDFYLPNLLNSVDKIRKLAADRQEVKNRLLDLDLADIFIQPGVLNKITSLDFKKVSLGPDIKSASDFVYALVQKIISDCSPFQLEILYRPLLSREDLTPLQIYLRDEVAKEIRQRMSVAKMVYSIVLGKKKEYDRLDVIKKRVKKESVQN